jgi:hypothetical protein
MEKISWTGRVRNEELLKIVKKERNVVQTIKDRKAKWIDHILHRKRLLIHFIEGKIEMTGGGGRRHKQLLNDIKEKRGYWKLKEKALDHTVWRTRFERGCGHVLNIHRVRKRLYPFFYF